MKIVWYSLMYFKFKVKFYFYNEVGFYYVNFIFSCIRFISDFNVYKLINLCFFRVFIKDRIYDRFINYVFFYMIC